MGSFTLAHWAYFLLVPITLLVLLIKAGVLVFRRLSNKRRYSQESASASIKSDEKKPSVGSLLLLLLYAATLYACAEVFSLAGSYNVSQLFYIAASLTALYAATVLYEVVSHSKKKETALSGEDSDTHGRSA